VFFAILAVCKDENRDMNLTMYLKWKEKLNHKSSFKRYFCLGKANLFAINYFLRIATID
jgi:hypothetical protein